MFKAAAVFVADLVHQDQHRHISIFLTYYFLIIHILKIQVCANVWLQLYFTYPIPY